MDQIDASRDRRGLHFPRTRSYQALTKFYVGHARNKSEISDEERRYILCEVRHDLVIEYERAGESEIAASRAGEFKIEHDARIAAGDVEARCYPMLRFDGDGWIAIT